MTFILKKLGTYHEKFKSSLGYNIFPKKVNSSFKEQFFGISDIGKSISDNVFHIHTTNG